MPKLGQGVGEFVGLKAPGVQNGGRCEEVCVFWSSLVSLGWCEFVGVRNLPKCGKICWFCQEVWTNFVVLRLVSVKVGPRCGGFF